MTYRTRTHLPPPQEPMRQPRSTNASAASQPIGIVAIGLLLAALIAAVGIAAHMGGY